MPRLATSRGIKRHWSYSVAEAAEALGVHRNTIRQWIRQGLPVISDGKPYLILGRDLKAFLDTREQKRKQPLSSGQLYCLPCHGPKRPAGGLADYLRLTSTGGTLTGICPDCDRMMHRYVSWTSLDTVAADLDVTITEAVNTLGEGSPPPANRHLSEVEEQ